MNNFDWTIFTKRITVNAAVEDIYHAWTTSEGLESWFLRKATFEKTDGSLRESNSLVQKGDQYHWFWYGYSDDHDEKGEITDTNNKDMVQFVFGGEGLVTVKIKEEEGENIVELTQEDIPWDDNPENNLFVGCGEGWTFYLANLKSILEGGIDLRNKNENISNLINS